MTDKRYCQLAPRDVSIRLDLISRVHGIEEAGSYFDSIPQNLRTGGCYNSLLNSYVRVKDVEKAETIMQKIRDLGLARSILSYNNLLNLYHQTQNHDKVESLVHEMQEEDIKFDTYTFGILISAYAATSNIEGIEKILTQIDSDPNLRLDWTFYSVAASGCRRVELFDKVFYLLKKSEELITSRSKTSLYFLITQYAKIGKKEEMMRLWAICRKEGNPCNRGYMAIIPSLLECDDIESAEKIFEEWESRKLYFDIRIPNFMIRCYCRKGLLEKAEAIVNRALIIGGKPNWKTWYYLARGYLQHNDNSKAVEYMKKSISIGEPGSMSEKGTLAACLDYLKGKRDLEGAEEFISTLRNKDMVSVDVHDRLMNWIKDMESSVNAIDELEGDSNKETSELSEHEEDKGKDSKESCLSVKSLEV